MRATIIGWYGTETIGDRAILAGILKSIGDDVEKIYLGSIYPFFTERTLFEDDNFYKKYLNLNQDINIFDSKKSKELEKSISSSDILVMGGGPLMHIGPMHMVNYAFKYAKKKKKRTVLMGNGIGPIFSKKFEKTLIEIVNNSDDVILRDSISLVNLENIFKKNNVFLDDENINVAYDPSVIPVLSYLKKNDSKKKEKREELLVNLRYFPKEYAKRKEQIMHAEKNINFFVNKLDEIRNEKVLLLPNHYFFIGGDDRDFYNDLKFKNKFKNISIQNEPLSLEQTLEKTLNAKACFGMRFHSVIFQTLLNGRNFVLDYTEPGKGKVLGFIKDVKFDMNRYINLQNLSDSKEINKLIENCPPKKVTPKIDHNKLDTLLKQFK
jgi:polysaccharide pyruvyl transferase WcaK-like protein